VSADALGHATVTRLGAEAAELPALEAIVRAAFPADERAPLLHEELARPWAKIWAAHVAERAAGVLVAWHVADELHVHSVATAPALRRRGIGLGLMRAAIAYARAEAARIVLLEVRRSNEAAVSLYGKLGFTVLGVRKGYYSNDGEDGLELILTLDPEPGALAQHDDTIDVDGIAQAG
jgi:ribosomal-protein-alanine N-acetyltransferase